MPRYLGPYDAVNIDGKEYQRGDNVNLSKERIDQLRSYDRYRFEGDDPVAATPIVSNTPDEAHLPNEQGVPEAPRRQTSAAGAESPKS